MNANKQDAGGLPDYADALQVVEHVLRLIDEKVMLTKEREGRAADRKRAEASEQAYTLMCGHGEAIRDALRRNGEQCRAASVLTADMAKALPGGKLDDSTFQSIEEALDAAEAPMRGADGKWLTLSERIRALSRGVPEGK